jgi:folate-binding protein YgfZ
MFNSVRSFICQNRPTNLIYNSKRGIVNLKGRDSRDFLQRMSTNDLTRLSANNPICTSFVNNIGRMIDHCLIFEKTTNEFILVSSHENAHVLWNWISKFQFVEDFNMQDISDSHVFSYVIKLSEKILATKTSKKIWQTKLDDNLSIDIFGAIDYETQEKVHIIDEDLWQTLRIFALMPTCPNEINNMWMPHNINLGQTIADNKGCYLGQEVIAKARTYQKKLKILCGLIFKEELKNLSEGSIVNIEDKAAVITSLAPIQLEKGVNALAIVDIERNFFTKNTSFMLDSHKIKIKFQNIFS